jgi:osmotically-inducible protein OsmY
MKAARYPLPSSHLPGVRTSFTGESTGHSDPKPYASSVRAYRGSDDEPATQLPLTPVHTVTALTGSRPVASVAASRLADVATNGPGCRWPPGRTICRMSGWALDPDLQRAALDVLAADPALLDTDVTAEVRHGIALLHGEVHDEAERAAATYAVSRVLGISRVIDAMTPTHDQDVRDSALRSAVQQVTTELDGFLPDRVSVSEAGGRVTLDGELNSDFHRLTVVELIAALPAVTDVVDRIRLRHGFPATPRR